MASDSRISQAFAQFRDKISEQVWFQQLKGKWEELDPQSQGYLKAAGLGASALLVLTLVFGSLWRVNSLKRELAEKSDLLHVIQSANDEMRRLRDSSPSAAQGGMPGDQNTAPWPTFFESLASTAGIDKAAMTLSPERGGGATDMAKESLFDVSFKKVNIKQLVRYAFHLENSSRPVKLRNMTIDTAGDPNGYLDATFAVSAFTLKQ